MLTPRLGAGRGRVFILHQRGVGGSAFLVLVLETILERAGGAVAP